MSAEQINGNGIDPDKPISKEEEDLLGRYPLATRIADMINNLGDDYKHSIVIGIEGEWGAGKSSFIELILGRVDPKRSKPRDSADSNVVNERNIVIEFNPWNFSNRNELIKDFFSLIDEKLSELGTNMKGRFKKFVSKLKPSKITLNPSVSVMGTGGGLGEMEWDLSDDQDLGESLQKQRAEIEKGLEELNRRIIIVIDDIDRLDIDETKLIFRLVKLTSNFPNTVFLLAYDRVKVGERMNEGDTSRQDGIKGEEYLKKIIQLPFLIPKPDPEDIESVLYNTIKTELALVGFNGNKDDEKQIQKILDAPKFKELFQTVRDIKRYANSLRLDLRIINNEEINMGDFLGIEAIRVFAPEMYLAMTNENLLFTRAFSTDEIDAVRKEQIKGIVAKVPEGLVQQIRGIILQLFPQVRELETNEQGQKDVTTKYVGALQAKEAWANAKRVCSEEMYDKYFQLSVPKSRLSVGEMESFIPLVVSMEPARVEEIRRRWKKFEDQGKIRSISRRLRGYLDGLSDLEKKALLVNVFDFAEKTKDRKQGPSDEEDFATQAERTGYRILEEIQVGRAQFLEVVIDWTMGFFVMTKLIKTLMNGQLENSRIRKGEEPLLTAIEKEKIRKTYIAKIKSFSQSQEVPLERGREWGETLDLWKVWGEERDVKIYIENMIRTDKGVLSLLREFDRMSRAPLAMTARKMLEEFIDLSKLDQRVDTIDRNGLSEGDDRIVELYKNPPKDPRDSS